MPITPGTFDNSSTMVTSNKLNISDLDFQEIISVIGYPLLNNDNIASPDYPLSYNNIADLCVYPAYRLYQRYRPIVVKTYQGIGQQFTIPFPTADIDGNPVLVIGVVDCRISVYLTAATLTGNPWADFRLFDGQIMNRFNKSGLPYEKHTSFLQEIENRTWINLRKTGKFTVDYRGKKLIGATSMVGDLEVHWQIMSSDFNDIPWTGKDDVIRLSQANLLRYIAMLDSQQMNNTGINFDASAFTARADTLEQEITKKWTSRTKVVILGR